MSSSTESLPVAVKQSPRSDHKFVTFLNAIADGLTGNASFVNPTTTPAMIKAAADGLAVANGKAKGGGTAEVSDRNAKRKDGEALVDDFVNYVRVTVRTQAGDAATATAMIHSVALSVRKRTPVKKPPFAAKYGPVSGEVVLVALAMARDAMYWYEYSLDQKTWSSVPPIMKSRVTVTGLTPGSVYYFRFRAQARKAMSDYSQIVSLMVH